jgi:hypothetical protein
MGTLTSVASAFIDLTWISDTEVVSNISPSIGVNVEVLDVSHLCVAGYSQNITKSALNHAKSLLFTYQLVLCIAHQLYDGQQIQMVAV